MADAASGLITTRTPLDRERQAQFTLLLVAADKGTVPQQTTRLLTVHVTDVDDHKPVFKRSVVSRSAVKLYAIRICVGGVTDLCLLSCLRTRARC